MSLEELGGDAPEWVLWPSQCSMISPSSNVITICGDASVAFEKQGFGCGVGCEREKENGQNIGCGPYLCTYLLNLFDSMQSSKAGKFPSLACASFIAKFPGSVPVVIFKARRPINGRQ